MATIPTAVVLPHQHSMHGKGSSAAVVDVPGYEEDGATKKPLLACDDRDGAEPASLRARFARQVYQLMCVSQACQSPRVLALFIGCLIYIYLCVYHAPLMLVPLFVFSAFTCLTVPGACPSLLALLFPLPAPPTDMSCAGMRCILIITAIAMLLFIPPLREAAWNSGKRAIPTVKLVWDRGPNPPSTPSEISAGPNHGIDGQATPG